MKAKLVHLTPELAQRLLDMNTGNRPVRRQLVAQLAGAIERDEWEVNGEAVKVSDTGRLIDGQHRCLAVIKANKPIDTIYIEGLRESAQETMDQGAKRNLSDTLKIRGEKDRNRLAAAVRCIWSFETYGDPVPQGKTMTVQQGIACLDRNADLRDSVAETAYMRTIKWIPGSMIAGLHYLFSIVDANDATTFISKLGKGTNLDARDPIWHLRSRLMAIHMDNSVQVTARHQAGLIIKAWNLWRQGQQIDRLVFTPGGANPDRFPHIDGLVYPGENEASNDTEEVVA